MRLEVGMYVRTKAGMIAQIILKEDVSGSLHREEIVFILYNGNRLALQSKKVVKASHNIIDLIEVGDYVNGYLVTAIFEDAYHNKMICVGQRLVEESGYYKTYYSENVKTIVTKEQFKTMEYVVGKE